MTLEEQQAIWANARKRHLPTFLAVKWEWRVSPAPSVERFVAALRWGAQAAELDDPATAPAYVGRLMAALLQPFESLVEHGKLDDVLPHLSGLPILYSPHAGKGAGGWEHASRLYKSKAVGTACRLEFWGQDSSRNHLWRDLAWDTVWVIQAALIDLPRFRQLRGEGTPWFTFTKAREGARKEFRFEVFRLPNDELLAWPDWLDCCAEIPSHSPANPFPVKDAPEPYLVAARAVLDNFFCDPDNPYAEEIIAGVTGMREGLPRAFAVAEARKNVLEVIARM